MLRCRHGSFQDTEYGIHGNQYDMFLGHFQPTLKKKKKKKEEKFKKNKKTQKKQYQKEK